MAVYGEPWRLAGLTHLHQRPGKAFQSRALRRYGFPLGQEGDGASSRQGHWAPAALSTLSGPGAGLHPQPPLVHPGL